MKRLLINLCVTMLTLLVCCVLLELGMRVTIAAPAKVRHTQYVSPYDGSILSNDQFNARYLVYQPFPGVRHLFRPHSRWFVYYPSRRQAYLDSRGYIEMRTGEHGFRFPEGSWKRPAGTLRILVIGDSVSFGVGVPPDSIFSAVLQKRLRQIEPSVEVINMGVSGYLASEELTVLRRLGLNRDPDIVIWQLHLNDLVVMENLVTPSMQTGLPRWLLKASRLLNWMDQRLSATRHIRNLRSRYGLGMFTRPWMDERTDNFLATVGKAGSLLRTANLPCVAFLYPYPDFLDGRYPFQGVHDFFAHQSSMRGIVPVDLLPYLRGFKRRELWVDFADNHPNGLAHRLIARALVDALTELYGPDLSGIRQRTGAGIS